MNDEKPDVVFLQEVKFDPMVAAFAQSTRLNSLLEAPFAYEHASITRFHLPANDAAYREGLAVLSRYPVQKSESLVLTKNDADEHTRIVQNLDILINEKLMNLTNVHFSNNQYADDQFRELWSILQRRHEQRIIIGDFNIFNLSELNDMYNASYVSSYDHMEYISYPSEKVTLDYILLPRTYRFDSLTLAEGLSDHAALVAEISSTQLL